MGEIAEPAATQFLLDGDAKQTEFAKLRPQLARECVGAIDLVSARRDLVLREAARGVAQHIDLGAETEVEAVQGV